MQRRLSYNVLVVGSLTTGLNKGCVLRWRKIAFHKLALPLFEDRRVYHKLLNLHRGPMAADRVTVETFYSYGRDTCGHNV